MSVDDYVRLSEDFRVARGRMKFFREMCQELYLELESDLEGSRVLLVGEESPAEPDREDDDDGAPFQVSLGAWMTGSEISEAILEIRRIRAALEAAWAKLSEGEKRTVKSPEEI